MPGVAHGSCRAWFACLFAAVLLAPSAALADEPEVDDEDRAKAQAALDEGDKHLRRGDAMRKGGRAERAIEAYERALDAYQSAFDAVPESRIYYPIARAEEKLGRYLDAYRHYQIVLDDVDELSDRLRADVEQRQEKVRGHIAGVHVRAEPENARVAVDGTDRGRGPFDAPIYIGAGVHTLELSAESHEGKRFDLEVEEGDQVQLVVALEPVRENAEPNREREASPGPELPAQPESSPSRAPLVAGVSITAGLGLAATVTGLVAVSKHGTFTDEARPSDERQSARDTGQILAVTTDVLMIATAAAAGYTAYAYYAGTRDAGTEGKARAKGEPSRRDLWLAPYAAERGGGLALGGRF